MISRSGPASFVISAVRTADETRKHSFGETTQKRRTHTRQMPKIHRKLRNSLQNKKKKQEANKVLGWKRENVIGRRDIHTSFDSRTQTWKNQAQRVSVSAAAAGCRVQVSRSRRAGGTVSDWRTADGGGRV